MSANSRNFLNIPSSVSPVSSLQTMCMIIKQAQRASKKEEGEQPSAGKEKPEASRRLLVAVLRQWSQSTLETSTKDRVPTISSFILLLWIHPIYPRLRLAPFAIKRMSHVSSRLSFCDWKRDLLSCHWYRPPVRWCFRVRFNFFGRFSAL